MIFSFSKKVDPRIVTYKLSSDPEVIEFAKNHNIDLGPNGSTHAQLWGAMCKAINELEKKNGNK